MFIAYGSTRQIGRETFINDILHKLAVAKTSARFYAAFGDPLTWGFTSDIRSKSKFLLHIDAIYKKSIDLQYE